MSAPRQPKAWTSAATSRRVIAAGSIGAAVLSMVSGAGAYALAGDLVRALAVALIVGVASMSGVLVGVWVGRWYEDLMKRHAARVMVTEETASRLRFHASPTTWLADDGQAAGFGVRRSGAQQTQPGHAPGTGPGRVPAAMGRHGGCGCALTR